MRSLHFIIKLSYDHVLPLLIIVYLLEMAVKQLTIIMHTVLNDKENQIPPIQLDFKKKNKSKPNSERTNSNSSLLRSPNTKLISNNTIALLQKKKQYSESLRQKIVHKEVKRGRVSEVLQDKINTQVAKFEADALKISKLDSLNHENEYYSTRTQKDVEPKKSTKSSVFHSIAKKEQKSKGRDTKKQKSKFKQSSTLIETSKNLSFNQNLSMISISQHFAEQMMNQDFSVIEKINELSRTDNRTQLCSRQIDQCFGPFQTEQKKEIELIKKQNNTFKKELANFRREITSLKRQTGELKKQLAIFKERNQYLENQSSEQFKMLQSLQSKVSQSIDFLPELDFKQESFVNSTNENEQKLREIIANYENELFQVTNLNKKLQFKNYMLEKKLMDEGELHKKQMAKQIAVWKQRYIKARNQNLRLKDSRSHMLFEMSISQQS